LQAVEASLIDAAYRADGVGFRSSSRLEGALPAHAATPGALVLDAQLGSIPCDWQWSIDDSVTVGAQLVVAALQFLDDLAAAVERKMAHGLSTLALLVAFRHRRMPIWQRVETPDRIPNLLGACVQSHGHVDIGHRALLHAASRSDVGDHYATSCAGLI